MHHNCNRDGGKTFATSQSAECKMEHRSEQKWKSDTPEYLTFIPQQIKQCIFHRMKKHGGTS